MCYCNVRSNFFEVSFKHNKQTKALICSLIFLLISRTRPEKIVLSFVVCDSRFNESLNVIKSALLFTKTPLHFVIFSDEVLRPLFNKTLSSWRILTNFQLNFELQNINFPGANKQDWLNLFSKCAAQRLFIPVSTYNILLYLLLLYNLLQGLFLLTFSYNLYYASPLCAIDRRKCL